MCLTVCVGLSKICLSLYHLFRCLHIHCVCLGSLCGCLDILPICLNIILGQVDCLDSLFICLSGLMCVDIMSSCLNFVTDYLHSLFACHKFDYFALWVPKAQYARIGKFRYCLQTNRRFCLWTVAEQFHYDLKLLSRVHSCTAQLSLFRNNMINEIAACGFAACAVVMFSNKNNVSRLCR